MQEELAARLRRNAVLKTTPQGKSYACLELGDVRRLAEHFSLSVREIEICALQNAIIPERYQRNMGTIGPAGQVKLLEAKVAVIGAGGLGGTIIELLARQGIGTIVVVDGDVFSENNLNRQILATEADLTRNKAVVAASRVKAVNSAVTVIPHPVFVNAGNIDELIAGADVVVDALDNLPTRLMVEKAAKRLGIPLVHGAIAGFTGQVMTVFPEDPGLSLIYGQEGEGPVHGIESLLGNPAATPAMTAAWQVQEVIKIILGKGEPLRNRLLYLDAEGGHVEVIELS